MIENEIELDMVHFINDQCDLHRRIDRADIVAIVNDTYQMCINHFFQVAKDIKKERGKR